MSFKYKSKRLLKIVLLIEVLLLPAILGFWLLSGQVWTAYNFRLLDWFYRLAVQYGYGPPRSPQVVYVTITDESDTALGTRNIDRREMARVNIGLAQLGVASVAYDLMFPYPIAPDTDRLFTDSLTTLGKVYLPIALNQETTPTPFDWKTEPAYERLRSQQLQSPHERGTPRPFYASRALMQLNDFAIAALNTAHITAPSDADEVYRHLPLLIKIDAAYLPTLALSMFLDAVKVPLSAVTVAWGDTMTIPALAGSTLKQDVSIPIDEHGRVFVPFVQPWRHEDAAKINIPIHLLLQYLADPNLRGNLEEFFENKFVFIGDVSTGISDFGPTPLDKQGAPLVSMHAALLNGLLTQTFYSRWPFWETLALIACLGVLLGLVAIQESSLMLYVTSGTISLGLVVFTWLQHVHFMLFPLLTVGVSFACLFAGMVIGRYIEVAKDQAFIRNTFAKYVSEKVVNELMQHPELIKPGGEERVLSVMFTDIANYTTVSEQLTPTALVRLLNEYLTEMTNIVLEEGGIIDKYVGDAIMAEFGVPIPIPQHADLAVRTGLRMQRRLRELRPQWEKQGLPEIQCRVGINTGPMVVGNIGSAQVFDYTVIGDAVNLASRLEGANKHYHTEVMISEFTHDALSPDLFRMRLLDIILVQGKSQAVKVYEVYGESTETLPPDDVQYYQMYDEAFNAYLNRDFDKACTQFAAALASRPQDASAREMLERIASLDPATLPEDWNPAVSLSK